MALTRGSSSNFPCPICLAPRREFVDLMKAWPLRTVAHTQEVIWQARQLRNPQDREGLLSSESLRNVDVIDLFSPY